MASCPDCGESVNLEDVGGCTDTADMLCMTCGCMFIVVFPSNEEAFLEWLKDHPEEWEYHGYHPTE